MIEADLGRCSMDQYHVFRIACLVAAVPAVAALVAALAKGKSRGSIFLQCELACAVGILILNFLEVSSREPSRILALSHLTYALIAFVPVTWFLFALQFGLGRDTDLRPALALASVVPSITTILAFLGDRTGAIWESYGVERFGDLSAIVVHDYGPWFYIHVCYSYGLFLAGAVFVLWQFIGHYEVYRRQAVLIAAATGLPIVPNALYVLRLVPGQTKDFSSIAIAITGVLFTICVVKYRLLDLRPAPRERIIDYLDERVLIVDEGRRIVHCNKQASTDFAGAAGDSLIGRSFHDLFPRCAPEVFDSAAASGRSAILECVGPDGESRVSLTVKPVDPGPSGGLRFCVIARPAHAGTRMELIATLSKREREVASMLVDGLSVKEIALELCISENTAKTHIRHIYKKTGSGDRSGLFRIITESRERPSA
jgi:DNA-binding CsgD family transcriptional regulator